MSGDEARPSDRLGVGFDALVLFVGYVAPFEPLLDKLCVTLGLAQASALVSHLEKILGIYAGADTELEVPEHILTPMTHDINVRTYIWFGTRRALFHAIRRVDPNFSSARAGELIRRDVGLPDGIGLKKLWSLGQIARNLEPLVTRHDQLADAMAQMVSLGNRRYPTAIELAKTLDAWRLWRGGSESVFALLREPTMMPAPCRNALEIF